METDTLRRGAPVVSAYIRPAYHRYLCEFLPGSPALDLEQEAAAVS